MFFHKKESKEEASRPAKKVYDFENDKRKKIDVSALFDASNGKVKENPLPDETKDTKQNSTIAEFVLDLSSNDISKVEIKSAEENNDNKKKKENRKKVDIEEIENSDEEDDIDEDEEYEEDESDDDEEFVEFEEENQVSFGKIFKTFFTTTLGIFAIVCLWAINSKSFLIKDIEDITFAQNNKVLNVLSGESIVVETAEDNIDATVKMSVGSKINEITAEHLEENIFLSRTSKIKKEIEKIPYVYRAKVERKLPDRLQISYTYREPYFNLQNGDIYNIVDKYGLVVDVSPMPIENIPKVIGIANNNYYSGDILSGTDMVKFKNLNYLVETAESIDFGYTITDIDYASVNDITIRVSEVAITIIYGSIDKNIMSDKLLYLKEILNKSVQNNYKGTLDLSSENYLSRSVLNSEF